MTLTNMTGTMARIGIYIQQAGHLPKSLDALPLREGYGNDTADGWNRPLIYEIKNDGFTLKSLGRDGVAGGTGEDADIVRKYRLLNGQVEEIR